MAKISLNFKTNQISHTHTQIKKIPISIKVKDHFLDRIQDKNPMGLGKGTMRTDSKRQELQHLLTLPQTNHTPLCTNSVHNHDINFQVSFSNKK